jgi:hypothetical protein
MRPWHSTVLITMESSSVVLRSFGWARYHERIWRVKCREKNLILNKTYYVIEGRNISSWQPVIRNSFPTHSTEDLTDWLNNKLTNSTELSSSREANGCSATQENFNNLWDLNVHYRIQNSPLLVTKLSHMNPVDINPFYFFKMHFNISLPSTSRSS